MRPHSVLIYGGALIAALCLVLGGRELAISFGPDAKPLDLAAPILAVVTALVCIAVLDWVRNLPRRGYDRDDAYDVDDAGPAVARSGRAASAADQELADVVHTLEQLARSETPVEKVIEESVKAVGDFARATSGVLWLADEEGRLVRRAEYTEGVVTRPDAAAPAAEDEGELRQVLESGAPMASGIKDGAKVLCPLRNGERWFGALRMTLAAGPATEGEELQKLIGRVAQVGQRLAHAIVAPGAYEGAILDPTTGLYSRRHLVNRLAEATSACRRYGEPLALVVLDIDSFRMLNASFGSAAADRVLQTVAGLVRANVRDADSVYRVGADEVAVVLPSTDVDSARAAAERLCRLVRESRTPSDDGNVILATASAGVAEFDEDMPGIEPLLDHAAEALQAAKGSGRDRVRTWQPAPEPAPQEDAGAGNP